MPAATAVSKLLDSAPSYESAQKAAVAALRSIDEKHVETGGGILFNPQTGKYAYTAPVGQNDEFHFRVAVRIPEGWQLQGIYHTHPAGPQSTVFSADDVAAAQHLKVPSYILPRYDDKIRVFDPASSSVSKSAGASFSPGNLVDETTEPAAPVTAAPSE